MKQMNKHNKTEIESWIKRTNKWLPERMGYRRKETGEGDDKAQTSNSKINDHQV